MLDPPAAPDLGRGLFHRCSERPAEHASEKRGTEMPPRTTFSQREVNVSFRKFNDVADDIGNAIAATWPNYSKGSSKGSDPVTGFYKRI